MVVTRPAHALLPDSTIADKALLARSVVPARPCNWRANALLETVAALASVLLEPKTAESTHVARATDAASLASGTVPDASPDAFNPVSTEPSGRLVAAMTPVMADTSTAWTVPALLANTAWGTGITRRRGLNVVKEAAPLVRTVISIQREASTSGSSPKSRTRLNRPLATSIP